MAARHKKNLRTPLPPSSIEATAVADRLHSAAIHLLRRLKLRDRESGMGPAQLSALSVLVFGGPRSLGELADAEGVRPPTMTRIAQGLARGGFVRRAPAADDRRRLVLEATAKGKRILQRARERRLGSLARALAELPAYARRALRDAIVLIDQVCGDL